jgi:hypothetical protein
MAKQTFTTGQVLTAAQVTALQTNQYNQTVTTVTTNYTLLAADVGTRVYMNAAGATTITVNTGVFAAGDTVWLGNIGAGSCVVTAGTATVSKFSTASLTLSQYQGAYLYFVSTGVAILYSDSAGASTPLTTKGDLFGYDTANARIPIGTNNQVLTADSAQALGLKWATPSTFTVSGYTLISTTTFASGTTYSISGLSGYNKLLFVWDNVTSGGANGYFHIRPNGDTSASNYRLTGGAGLNAVVAPQSDWITGNSSFSTQYTASASQSQLGALFLDGCNTTAIKAGWFWTGVNTAKYIGTYPAVAYLGTSVISSVDCTAVGGAFNTSGTTRNFYIYGSVN